jgi:5-formyltetrahydrofolate cyclo-ligase
LHEGEKAALRREALARRDALPPGERATAAVTITARPFPVDIPGGAVVSGYIPMRSEINPVPLMQMLSLRGVQLALPVVVGKGQPLIMRAWNFDETLQSGVWGTKEPKSDAREVEPDILLVPLAAFDRSGHRIGYGAGYYDLTLNHLRRRKPITAIGLAFAAQEIPAVPATPRDARVDLVLTEREVIDCRSA